jgi:hypothetical protein
MSRGTALKPELIILADNAHSIFHRFQGWPDLQAEPEQYAQTVGVPVFEQLPVEEWRRQLQQSAADHMGDLREAVQHLKNAFTSQQQFASWEGVAHSLLLHFLTFGVGSQWLFGYWQTETGAVVVNDLDASLAIWPAFRRSNQEFGLSCLIGAGYQRGQSLHQLLATPEVARSLASLDEERALVVTNASAHRVLNRLGGLDGKRPDGAYRVGWPTLETEQLKQPGINHALRLTAAALVLMLKQTVVSLVEQQQAAQSLQRHRPADLGVAALAIFAGVLAEDWQQAGLLPEAVQAVLDGLV